MDLEGIRSAVRHPSALAGLLAGALRRGAGVPAGTAAEPRGLTVRGDTVRAQGAVRTLVVRRTESVVFRAAVALDGQPVREAVVHVQIAGGPSLPMTLDGRAPRADARWYVSAPWPVGLGQRTGRVSYTITAVEPATGLSASWSPFPGPRTALTIVPYAYDVAVTVSAIGHAVRVEATVTRPIRKDGGRAGALPMSQGGVSATIGFDRNLSPSGTLKPLRSARLTYSEDGGLWTGLIATTGLGPGLYAVEVRAEDLVPTPNVGIGTSDAFRLARGA